jgi:hypothetical protein
MTKKRKVIGGYLYVCYHCRAIIQAEIYEGDNEEMCKLILDKFMKELSFHLDGKCLED